MQNFNSKVIAIDYCIYFGTHSTCTKDTNITEIFIQNQCTHCMYIVLIAGLWPHL